MTTYLDTSVILLVADGFPLFEQLTINGRSDIVLLTAVKHELETLQKENTKRGRAATVGLQYLQQQRLKTIQTTQQYGDAALLEVASPTDTIVTTDRSLAKKAKRNSITVLRPRKGNILREE